MVRSSPRPSGERRRAPYHLGLLVVLGLLLGAALAQCGQQSSRGSASTAGASQTPSGAAPALGSSGATNPARPAPVLAAAQSSDQQPRLPPKPTAARWVQNFRSTELFAGPGTDAASLGVVTQFNTYQLVEQDDGGRIRLFDPGRGSGRLPSYVWGNPQDFGPAGPPKPVYELASGGVVSPVSGRPIPERIGDSWPRIPSAEFAVVLDGDSGGVLYGKNSRAQVAPASLTKILTAIVAIERGNPQTVVKVDVDSRTLHDSTVMGLTPGESVSLETLLYGLMLPSGNDAALAIGRHVAGSDEAFVDLMNDKVRSLGLEDSRFRNAHGLDEEGHYSSAYDLAIMSRYGMQHPLFARLSAARTWAAEGYELWNLNRLLVLYPGADGIKVGYTDEAGRCIVASATRDGHRVFVTLIRSNDPLGESRALLDYAFQNFRWNQR